ncbi:diguanylate cyclase/phosphodiesterase (GGDEF & EAL domains) with PAS/PAC sensor(s) [Rhodovulum sp. P5]|uniref:EAL domain-containing protein n=1 Tax=Rhodovulum sp. P5 TaxID=1564506 RepID=UPI0009C2CA6B|nr:EAL domain-containing protein [Rhodovulum sp. P5]ARE39464.1 diguanylate cyclase/phosphodiesterase (GGDEF & EAL domains) with PAS/PAC sensor(s) [Rhodovulum sp. P5]
MTEISTLSTELLSALPHPAILVSADGTVLGLSDSARGLFDTSKDPLVGQPIRDLVLNDDSDAAEAAFAKALDDTTASVALDVRFRLPNDTGRARPAVARRVRLDPTTPAILLQLPEPRAAAGQDAPPGDETLKQMVEEAQTARKLAQEKADILRLATTNSSVVPWTKIPQTGESWFGENLNELVGLDADTVPDSAAFRSMIHPDDREAALDRQERLAAGTDQVTCHEFRVNCPDGKTRWFRSKGKRVDRSADGLPDMIGGSLTDITELKAKEERLSEALAEALTREHMLTASAQCGGMGYWIVSADDSEGWASDAIRELLGYGPGEFHSTHAGWRSLFHPDDVESGAAAMHALIDGRTEVYDHEHRLRHADGSYQWYRAVARKIDRSAEGLPYLISGAVMNIGKLKETQLRLIETAKAAQRVSHRLSKLADNIPGAVFERQQRADGSVHFPYLSAKMPDIFGTTHEAIAADWRAVFSCMDPEDRTALAEKIECSKACLCAFEARCRITHPEKGLRWVLISSLPYAQPDGSILWYGNASDITDQLAAERLAQEAAQEVRRAHERLSTVARIAPVGLYEFKWFGPGEVQFTYFSKHFEELCGFTREEIETVQGGIFARVHDEDRSAYLGSMAEDSRLMRPRHNRFRIHHPQRGLCWLAAWATPRKDEDGTVIWTGALIDVTADMEREAELRKAHEAAEKMRAANEWHALHDGLTNLPNRRYYDRTLAQRLDGARTDGPRDCVLIRIDLDHFKYVNDTLGHEAGDLVLIRVADVLFDCLRGNDFVARIGGDEFTILPAPGTTEAEACDLVDRLQAKLAEPLIYQGRQCRFGASFGIAHVDDLSAIGEDIQMFADAALYRAKATGRNRLHLFTPQLHREILTDRRLAIEIHEGLDGDQFVPFFQPQVSAADGRLVGAEALLRWQHPTEGILAPDAFLHVAEHLRLMPEIDRVMMMKSRDALERWQARGLTVPKISFNVSSGRMHDPDVISMAQEIASGQTRVTFELLESILVEEESDVFRFHLDAIRSAGIDIEIDDFGSGHASIIGLMEIAPSALKIDKRIVFPVAEDTRARNLVGAILEIANTLGIGTVAEGVETEAQVAILSGIGCDVLQGYYYSKPLPESEFERFALSANRSIA